jgi:voltage-gated potassium channel
MEQTRGGSVDLVLLGLILLSVLLVMMETVSEFDLKYHSYLVLLEWIITVLFTIEYIF